MPSMRVPHSILIFVVLFQTILTTLAAKPNVVVIMADDLGYECLGVNGSEDYKTPHLDRLATTGMRFTNAFANPLCTPSRVKLMTGVYNVQNYIKFGTLGRNEKTFAHTLKADGYKTCIVGKWQLGRELDSPHHFGFDEACLWQHLRGRTRKGGPYDTRFSNPRMEINGALKNFSNGEFGPDIVADFALDFIEKNQDKPFLVYYPMILTHCPFIPTPGTADWDPQSPGSPTYKGEAKYFADMDHHMDKNVGKIIAKLEELKLRENTIVIFTGDNGTDEPVVTQWQGRSIPGGKGQMNDNGTRVPLIVSYPGHIQPGSTSDELVDFTDIFPTLCDVTGTHLPEGHPRHGVSLWGTLQGKSGRNKPWAYFWYGRSGDQQKAHVIARTKTHFVRRMTLDAPMEYLDSRTPFDLKPLEFDRLSDTDQSLFHMLQKVITDFDRTRPASLRNKTASN
jgi:arylsulfatase A